MMRQKVLMLVSDDYEDLELYYPKYRLIEAGAEVVIATPELEKTYHGKHGIPCKGMIAIDKVNPHDYEALVLPGGYSPDHLRTLPKVKEIVQSFHKRKKLIAYICHAGWIPASAEVLKGVRVTSYHTIRDDLVHAGALWEDASVVQDGHFLSSRFPDDLPFFCKAIVEHLNGISIS